MVSLRSQSESSSQGSQKVFSSLSSEASRCRSHINDSCNSLKNKKLTSGLLKLHRTLIEPLSLEDKAFLSSYLHENLNDLLFSPFEDLRLENLELSLERCFIFILHCEILMLFVKIEGLGKISLSTVQKLLKSYQSTESSCFRLGKKLDFLTVSNIEIEIHPQKSTYINDYPADSWLSLSQTSTCSSEPHSTSTESSHSKATIPHVSIIWKMLNTTHGPGTTSIESFLLYSVLFLITELFSKKETLDSAKTMTPTLSDDRISSYRNQKRSFLDSDLETETERSQKFGSLPSSADATTGIVEICLQNTYLNQAVENLISNEMNMIESPFLNIALQYIEDLSLHTNAIRDVGPCLNVLRNYAHVVRWGLSTLKNTMNQGCPRENDHEKVLSLLKIALNLANENGCMEILLGKVFLNLLRSLYLVQHSLERYKNSGDILVLITCIFCTLIENAYRAPSKDENFGNLTDIIKPHTSVFLRWFTIPSDFLCALVSTSTYGTDQVRHSNENRVLSSYSSLLVGCFISMSHILSVSCSEKDATTLQEFRYSLVAAKVNIKGIAQNLQEFILFQSEAGVLTANNLKNFASVIEDILRFSYEE